MNLYASSATKIPNAVTLTGIADHQAWKQFIHIQLTGQSLNHFAISCPYAGKDEPDGMDTYE